ncbi:lipid A-modifier LpxR family protein [Ulvibacter antarcticus]|uniref:lipid A-modifier LpxR family protein n=1 Tax=Ulvibacter antarcticus TaxID=442714 RepID=UPI001472CBB9|nr:lipid A-modifier LpxR family protein [Ulvibacter antarcticus]
MICSLLSAQKNETPLSIAKTSTHQIELRHDNDFFVFRDRYYTTGSFITYRNALKNSSFSNGKEQLEIAILQQYYTPNNIKSNKVEDFDRPYVGYLGISTGWSFAGNSEFLLFKVGTGMMGPIAGAEEFQGLFHSSGGIDTPPWAAQIKNSVHINFQTTYAKEWQLALNPMSVRIALKPSLAFGTKDIYLQPEAVLYFGKRNPITSSSAYNQIGVLDREFYFSFGAAYRRVLHNSLLEGHPRHDSSVFLVEAEKGLVLFNYEFVYRAGRNTYKLAQNYVSKESEATKAHITFGFIIARSF